MLSPPVEDEGGLGEEPLKRRLQEIEDQILSLERERHFLLEKYQELLKREKAPLAVQQSADALTSSTASPSHSPATDISLQRSPTDNKENSSSSSSFSPFLSSSSSSSSSPLSSGEHVSSAVRAAVEEGDIWSGSNFPWSHAIKIAAWDFFGIRELRLNQKRAINVIMSCQDALLLMPTGGGKSLCFQLPALACAKRCLTLIISPLLSLMVDQWGHSFRPDYRQLVLLKTQFPQVPLLALTATATPPVIEDIKELLRIPLSRVFRSPTNRPNLFYHVVYKPKGIEQQLSLIAAFINKFPRQAGILYCLSRKEAETLCAALQQQHHIPCAFYHGDLDAGSRLQIHRQWASGAISVVVATVAFGLGINKADVRFVIHHSLPKSLDNYYQETGRAGRDGLHAHCLMLYRPADITRQSVMVYWEPTGLQLLYGMARFCTGVAVCSRMPEISAVSKGDPNGPAVVADTLAAETRTTAPVVIDGTLQKAEPLARAAGNSDAADASTTTRAVWRCRRQILCEHFGDAVVPCHQMCDVCFLYSNNTPFSLHGVALSGVTTGRRTVGTRESCRKNKDDATQQSALEVPSRYQNGGTRQLLQKNASPSAGDEAQSVGESIEQIREAIALLLHYMRGEDKKKDAAEGFRMTVLQLQAEWKSLLPRKRFGILNCLSDPEVLQAVLINLLLLGYLVESFAHTPYSTTAYLQLGPRARRVLRESLSVDLIQQKLTDVDASLLAGSPALLSQWDGCFSAPLYRSDTTAVAHRVVTSTHANAAAISGQTPRAGIASGSPDTTIIPLDQQCCSTEHDFGRRTLLGDNNCGNGAESVSHPKEVKRKQIIEAELLGAAHGIGRKRGVYSHCVLSAIEIGGISRRMRGLRVSSPVVDGVQQGADADCSVTYGEGWVRHQRNVQAKEPSGPEEEDTTGGCALFETCENGLTKGETSTRLRKHTPCTDGNSKRARIGQQERAVSAGVNAQDHYDKNMVSEQRAFRRATLALPASGSEDEVHEGKQHTPTEYSGGFQGGEPWLSVLTRADRHDKLLMRSFLGPTLAKRKIELYGDTIWAACIRAAKQMRANSTPSEEETCNEELFAS